MSPLLRTNSDHVDQNFPFFNYSDSLWALLDDHSSTILANNSGFGNLDHIFQGQENSSSTKFIENRLELHSWPAPLEASNNPSCSLVHENSILLPVEQVYDKTSCELNSCVFLDQQENSALAGPITDEGLLENSINDHEDDNILPTTLKALENLCEIFDGNHGASDKELQRNSAKHHNHDNSLFNCTDLEGTSNESRSLLEEGSISLNSGGFDSSIITEQAEASPAQATPIIDKGLLRNHKSKRLQSRRKAVHPNGEGQISKKEEHNAKEKIRRMKLNATYLALGALLPDHRRTKKRSSAPGMIDKTLEYIPGLEKEIEDLTLRKNHLLSTIEKQNLRETQQLSDKLQAPPMVSLHEIAKGEVIIQIICIQKDEDTTFFSKLLQNVEAQAMSIFSASTLHVCMERVCYHLHIQVCFSYCFKC
ncbi:hypothetical protein LWI28_015308 [Acer negundo]|uniref:BHLH domain-containing protein n=1 Tax=Acer negundo TaxID=4023 RepID=A0AAD5IU89_ACENE|nr:hypothetical protein LWI28_015308 [Acer negundo]KAK4845051.1 hypothetical protein QYF36_000211 [Acer negundo]